MNSSKRESLKVSSNNKYEELEIEKEIREVFKIFDTDNSGSICGEELSRFLFSIGKSNKPEEVEKILKDIDRDQNDQISEDELVYYLKNSGLFSKQSDLEEIIECFKVFDSDGDMKITKQEMSSIFRKFNINDITNADIDMVFDAMDIDGDGYISYAEFVHAWK